MTGKKIILHILLIGIYLAVTICIYFGRFQVFFTNYGLSGIDTDPTLWFYWAIAQSFKEGTFFVHGNRFIGFPYGYDFSNIPYQTILYDLIIFINCLFPSSKGWGTIIPLSNFFSLFTYVPSAYFTYRLAHRICGNSYSAFLASIIFGFSYVFVIYGGGALALNQIWVIPLYYWSLIRTIELGYRTRDVILTAFIFAISFGISPYWGGYCFFFSPVFIYGMNNLSITQRLKGSLKLYLHFTWVFISVNTDMLLSTFQLLSVSRSKNLGFAVDHIGQLIAHMYEHFIPQHDSLLHSYSQNTSYYYLGTITLGLVFIYLIFFKKRNIIHLFFLCFVISILFSTNISPFYGLTDIVYKLYLRFFRAVTRLHFFSILFIAIVAADSFKQIVTRLSKKKQAILCILCCTLILLENCYTGARWLVSSDMRKLSYIYSAVTKDPDVKVIMNYPPFLDYNLPFPYNFMFMSQIVHGKIMVNGFDMQNPSHMNLRDKLKDLSPKTIDTWQDIGVDMLLVYVYPYPVLNDQVDDLLKDKRVREIGRYTTTIDHNPGHPEEVNKYDIRVLRIERKLPNDYSRLIGSPEKLEIAGEYTEFGNSIFHLHFDKAGRNNISLKYPYDPRWSIISIKKNLFSNNLSSIHLLRSTSAWDSKINTWSLDTSESENYYLLWTTDLLRLPSQVIKYIVIASLILYFLYVKIWKGVITLPIGPMNTKKK